ncbi:putative baseplate assembly protein [Nocardioides sp. zg-1230]|uniref:putative baseplate assembly protein n=1 Tax=Nocardioides sp. zg-1230 TaxID=2736601 RepID=UPI0015570CD3|nr:putative baseplate assembly protein [Nocardioides sp. zg-1230]NPC44591.1 putative baseplate assembly protein [Nocardioides sp. zg-1230]
MPITGPVLDDRTYEQLREELVRRIPAYTPEWTNHNESDPGIALIELFASLGESMLFRFNQIPDSTKVAFLNLLGARPRPPQVARALLALTTERPEGVPVPKGTQALAGAVAFETLDETVAWPLSAVAVGKVSAGDDEVGPRERRRRQDAAARVRQSLGRPVVDPATDREDFYRTQRVPEDPAGTAPALDVSETLDQSLWIALVSERPDVAARPAGRLLFLGVVFDEQQPDGFDLDSEAAGPGRRWLADTLTPDPPETRWELWAGPEPGPGPRLLPLSLVRDTTRGMTTTGVVALDLPQQFPVHERGAVSVGDYHSPPPLDPEQAAGVVAWLRVVRPRGENDAIHTVRWVGLNAVEVEQASTAGAELLGIGTGEPGQLFTLTKHPVLAGTIELDVEEDGGWTRWSEVESLAMSRQEDAHYSLDTQSGQVTFGTRSRVPQLGQRVRVVRYRHGGGAAGNVPAGAIARLSGVASVEVRNVLAARGGRDPAPLSAALAEVPAYVHRRDRAVAAEDFTALALEVSGVRRAETLSLFHPDTPDVRRAGVLSVVIFPEEDLRDPAAPLPDNTLLRRVAAHLDPRRLVTAELYVIPPTYRKIAVSVGVRVKDGYQIDAVRRWVELLLRQYLAPVPPYGPGGSGWPLGRPVRRAELEAVAVQVEGVDSLDGELLLARQLEDDSWLGEATVRLRDWEVPELAVITAVSGTPLPIGVGYVPPPDPETDPVVVPLPPEVCQ